MRQMMMKSLDFAIDFAELVQSAPAEEVVEIQASEIADIFVKHFPMEIGEEHLITLINSITKAIDPDCSVQSCYQIAHEVFHCVEVFTEGETQH